MRTADADLLPVPHPEFISVDPIEERTVIVWRGDGGSWTIDLELVTELKPLNGKTARPRRWRRS